MNRIAISTAFLLGIPSLGGHALAHETTPNGVSVAVGLEQDADGSVAEVADTSSGVHRAGHFDAKALGNIGDFALGAGVAWVPDVLGDGRLLLGGRAGWQPSVAGMRLQVLGEAGLHRFTNVRGGLFSSSTPSTVDLPYVGMEVGLVRGLTRGGHLEGGLALFVRQDLGTRVVSHQESGFDILGTGNPPPPPTLLRVGGTMVGAVLTIGFRVETPRGPRT